MCIPSSSNCIPSTIPSTINTAAFLAHCGHQEVAVLAKFPSVLRSLDEVASRTKLAAAVEGAAAVYK
jgi:hypothetical protein